MRGPDRPRGYLRGVPQRHLPQPREGEVWADTQSEARVLAVREGYAMLRRHRHNPFLISVAKLEAGADGWRKVSP